MQEEKIYEYYQGDKLWVTGTKQDIMDFTGWSKSTVDLYCTPGYLENTYNELDNKIIEVTDDIKKPEQQIQNEILLAASNAGHRLWRANAGKIQTVHGGWVKLFPKGFPDTVGYRANDGKFIAIEVKNKKGKLSREQVKFAEFAKTQPIIYGVARSAEEAMEIIEHERL